MRQYGGKLTGRTILILLGLLCALTLYLAYGADLSSYSNMIVGNISFDILGMFVCWVIFSAICEDTRSGDNIHFMGLVLLEALILFADTVAWLIDGNSDLLVLSHVLNLYLYSAILLMISVYWLYVRDLYAKYKDVEMLHKVVAVLFVVGLAVILLNPLTGWLYTIDPDTAIYQRADLFFLSSVFPGLIIIIALSCVVRYEDNIRRKATLIGYVFIPAVATAIQIFNYGSSMQYFALLFSIVLMFANIYLSRSTELIRDESEMIEQNAAVMVSQIQPHFLYNALTSIMNIKGNPADTRDAIAEFGHYLRKNLDSLSQVNPIPIAREMDHVETYLNLIGLKYQDNIKVELSVNDTEFFIPPQTVKIILEHAVRFNIVEGKAALNMEIRTDHTRGMHVVSLIDRSPSLTSKVFVNNENEEDIAILRTRLRNMVSGSITNTVTPEGHIVTQLLIPESRGQVPWN